MHHGAALAVQDRPACEPVLRKALSQRRAMYGDNNARTGEARLYLGVCLLKRGQHAEGRGLIERGRGEFVRQFGGKHFVVRLADERLGSG
jgi:hypothetical protein